MNNEAVSAMDNLKQCPLWLRSCVHGGLCCAAVSARG